MLSQSNRKTLGNIYDWVWINYKHLQCLKLLYRVLYRDVIFVIFDGF